MMNFDLLLNFCYWNYYYFHVNFWEQLQQLLKQLTNYNFLNKLFNYLFNFCYGFEEYC